MRLGVHTSNFPPLSQVIAAMTKRRGTIRVLEATRRGRPAPGHPPLVTPAHHDSYELAICYGGESNIVGDASLQRLRTGDALLVMPGAWHYESYRTASQPYKLCWLIEHAQWIGCVNSTYARGTFNSHSTGGVPMLEQHAVLRNLVRESREQPPHWQVKARSMLVELLIEIDRRLRHAPHPGNVHELDPVWRLLRIVETRFREPLQLRRLAGEVGLSQDYLGRRFRALYGTSFKHYLHQIRIHHAQLLLTSGWSVKQAAAECGFADEFYFNRIFKQLTRITPGKFRRTARPAFLR